MNSLVELAGLFRTAQTLFNQKKSTKISIRWTFWQVCAAWLWIYNPPLVHMYWCVRLKLRPSHAFIVLSPSFCLPPYFCALATYLLLYIVHVSSSVVSTSAFTFTHILLVQFRSFSFLLYFIVSWLCAYLLWHNNFTLHNVFECPSTLYTSCVHKSANSS